MLAFGSISIRKLNSKATQKYILFNPSKLPKRKYFSSSKYSTVGSSSSSCSHNEKMISNWIFCLSGLVAGMVTVGGITRLTRSGLSMTDWKLQGSLPPVTPEQWNNEFERYKTFPEWQQRQSMTIDEFKFIYFWEYGHRMMGRFIGLAFVGPFLYFSYKKMIPRSLYPRLGFLFTLGGTQGLVGWWMVKSGLNVDPSQKKEIRVSPYRLATHLALAFTTYTFLLWTAFDLRFPKSTFKAIVDKFPKELYHSTIRLQNFSAYTLFLTAMTALSGAYVAGNDAGKAYGTFPMMGDVWIPEEILDMKPLWRNFFENTATVQFDHRVLAISTLSAVSLLCGSTTSSLWKALPRLTKLGLQGSLGMCIVQVSLGISTLLMVVPVPLAATHQAGSLVLLSCITFLCHSLRFASHLPLTTTTVKKITSKSPIHFQKANFHTMSNTLTGMQLKTYQKKI